KNTTSHSASGAVAGSEKAMSTRPRREAYMSATGSPASLREVITRSSAAGCWASRRSSSTPVYPVPPTIPTLIMTRSRCLREEKKPPAGQGGFLRYQWFQRGAAMPAAQGMSALGELLAASRLVQADLLALDLARIARDQPGLRQ